MDKLYLDVTEINNETVLCNLHTAVVLSIYHYLRYEYHLKVIIYFVTDISNYKEHNTLVVDCKGIQFIEIEKSNLEKPVSECSLPVFLHKYYKFCTAGICAVLRQLIMSQGDCSAPLLGFRGGCLKACLETSKYTKFCEADMLNGVNDILMKLKTTCGIETYPDCLLILESILNQPAHLHNVGKMKSEDKKRIKRIFIEGLDVHLIDLIILPMVHFLFFLINAEHSSIVPLTVLWYNKMLSIRYIKDTLEKLILIQNCTNRFRVNTSLMKATDGEDNSFEVDKVNLIADITPNLRVSTILNGMNNGLNLSTDMDEYVTTNKKESEDNRIEKKYVSENVYSSSNLDSNYTNNIKNFNTVNGRNRSNNKLPDLDNKNYVGILNKAHSETVGSMGSLNEINSKTDMIKPCLTVGINASSNMKWENKSKSKLYTKQKDIDYAIEKIINLKLYDNLEYPCLEINRIDWSNVPFYVHPEGGKLPPKRLKNKMQQIENLIHVVSQIVTDGDIIVDFCCGGGHVGIVLAYILQQCTVMLLDNNERSLNHANERITKLNLRNIFVIQSNVDYFTGKYNIGVALHACGVVTDIVTDNCVKQNASFVVSPCCYGKIMKNHILTYPRSELFLKSSLTYSDYIVLAHTADQTHKYFYDKTDQGEKTMDIIDTDRCLYLREHGYNVYLTKMEPLSCTPKHNIIVGIKQ